MPSFINRFFHRKTSLTQPPAQSEAPPAQPGTKVDKVSGEKPDLPLSDSPMGNHSIETPQIIVGIGQSVGIQRDSNEDLFFTSPPTSFRMVGRSISVFISSLTEWAGMKTVS